MTQITRRKFMTRSLATAAGVGVGLNLPRSAWSQVRGANETIRIGIAGLRGKGNGHIKQFSQIPGVRIVALCDPDKKILDQRAHQLTHSKTDDEGNVTPAYAKQVETYADAREMLDNKDIDAIVISTPNHWHALMAIWACQAGKHVYVEKPVSHTIWEGRQIVKAARKYNRIVQAGTQHRSCPSTQEAAADIKAGKYGKVLWAHCSKLGARGSIGMVTEPQPVPDHIDYNLWAGPTEMSPVMRKRFHYDWHWQWKCGDGEMGNWGPHYVDDLRHILGWDSVPTSVVAAGNRFGWDDNGQTPNMHMALFDYDGVKVVVDIRNLPDPKGRGGKQGAIYLKSRGGNVIQCEDAVIRLSRGGGKAYTNDGKPIKQYKGDGGKGHAQNFIDAIRSGRQEDLNAEIEVGHLSTAMCHMANIGFRTGAQANDEQIRESMKNHDDALNTYASILTQLEGNEVDLKKTPFILGPKLTFDRKTERFTGDHAEVANTFVKGSYRKPFVVPDEV